MTQDIKFTLLVHPPLFTFWMWK